MWSDNESSIDLLGFRHLVAAITSVVTDATLLPATVGVFGDWGSGKSSLMQMARAELEKDEDILVLAFNGWLFEGYDDAKTALMGTILDEVASRKKLTVKSKELVLGLLRRVNFMRVAAIGGKALVGYAAGGLTTAGVSVGADVMKLGGELWEKAKTIEPEKLGEFLKENEPGQTMRRGVREFRKDFAELLKETKVKILVVMIDDLDRCMPDTVIETLEAIKLFLFVPGTAFVIGADERLVQYAVRQRFPELPGERAEVGRDYLEKLVQFPVRVSPLSRAELETYINLLFAQKSGCTTIQFEQARERVVASDADSLLEVRFNHGIAEELFGKVEVQLAENLALAERIAPVLAGGLLGNPRQCKRFLNTLVMRVDMARSRGIELKQRVLVKLMLLEYFLPEFFKRLAELQAEAHGKPGLLARAELEVRSNSAGARTIAGTNSKVGNPSAKSAGSTKKSNANAGEAEGEKIDSRDLSAWLGDRWMRDWLASEPALVDEDLGAYFYFARDRLGPMGGVAQRMSPRAQEMLAQLFHESAAVRGAILKKSKDLGSADVAAVFEALAERARREEDHGSSDAALVRIFDWVEAHPDLFSQLIALLDSLPEAGLPPSVVLKLLALSEGTEKIAVANKILEKWVSSSSNDILRKAAEGRLKPSK